MSVSRRSSAARAVVRVAVLAAVLAGAHPALSSTVAQSPSAPVVTAADLVTVPAATAEEVEVTQDEIEVPITAAGEAQASLQRRAEPEQVEPDVSEPEGAEPGMALQAAPEVVAHLSSTRTDDFGLLGVTWDAGTAAGDLVVQVRTRTGETWTSWEDVDVEEAQVGEGVAVREGTAPIWVGESDGVAVRLLSTEAAPSAVRVELIDGGTGLAEPFTLQRSGDEQIALMSSETSPEPAATPGVATTSEDPEVTATTVKEVSQPAIVRRKNWGADSSTESTCSSPIRSSVLKGVVIHHTAGANGYTKDESPGIVRGIHRYHTKSLGWCDIGYNFLVDTYGTIYQGRRGGILRQIRGAHAGNWDVNKYTTGISMMGNFELVDVPQAMRTAVVKLTAWRLNEFGLDAYGKYSYSGGSIETISGHRDIYKAGIRPATATACPGRYGDAWLNSTMRGEVQRVIDTAPTVVVTTTPSPSPTDGWQDLPEETETSSPTPTPTPRPTATPSPSPTPETQQPRTPTAYRLSGTSRYATAASISQETFTHKDGAVFLAAGDNYADALSGGPAAAGRRAPVLLTAPDSIPSETIAELERLEPARIYILGGENALSPAVEQQAAQYTERVVRLAGADRFDTGVVISKRLWASSAAVYIASGLDYPDALSGGALAALDGSPMLLAGDGVLVDSVRAELQRLNPKRVVILGGTVAVNRAVQSEIAATVPNATITRLAGSNRYATSAAIAKAGGWRADRAYFAAGTNFPDALAGVPAAASYAAPLLLTTKTCVPEPVGTVANSLNPDFRYLLGGSMVLEDRAASAPC